MGRFRILGNCFPRQIAQGIKEGSKNFLVVIEYSLVLLMLCVAIYCGLKICGLAFRLGVVRGIGNRNLTYDFVCGEVGAFNSQLQKATSQAKTKVTSKKMSRLCYTAKVMVRPPGFEPGSEALCSSAGRPPTITPLACTFPS